MCCCRLFQHEVHYYSLSLSSVDSCLFYGVPVVWVSVLSSPCLHWCWFVLYLTWASCMQRCRNSIYLWNKNKNNYRSRWCIQTNCRSVSHRQLHISSDSTYTTSTTYWLYHISTNFGIMIVLGYPIYRIENCCCICYQWFKL